MSPQTTIYGNVYFDTFNSDSMDDCTGLGTGSGGDHSAVHLSPAVTRHRRLSGEALTATEAKAKEALRSVTGDTGWGAAIVDTLRSGSATRFRELINCLQSQGQDNPGLMVQIIGREAWEAVLTLFI